MFGFLAVHDWVQLSLGLTWIINRSVSSSGAVSHHKFHLTSSSYLTISPLFLSNFEYLSICISRFCLIYP